MSQPSFPLYCLPHLVRHEVIKTMDPLELLILSKTSRKSHSLVKSATKKFKLIIFTIAKQEENSVVFGFGENNAEINIETRNERCELVRESINGDKTTVPSDIQYNKNNLIIYGNDKVEGFTKAIELLVDTFNAKIALFQFHDQLESTIKQVLACTKLHNLRTRQMIISGDCLTHNTFNLILEESRHAFKLFILSGTSNRMENNVPPKFPLKAQELNSFLKKWKLEKWGMISMLLTVYDNFDFEMAVEGLNGEIAKEMKMESGEIHKLQPGEGYTIQRNDGVKATVRYVNRHFIMQIDH